MKIEEKEVWRYLGYRQNTPDEATAARIRSCIEELGQVASPRSVSRRKRVAFEDGSLRIGDIEIASRKLSRHIAGCREAVLFAATLGAQVDFFEERASKMNMEKAAIIQAAAAAMIESYCDEQSGLIARETEREGLFLRPRFSPGYGDFSILHQRDFLRELDCPKRIGLSMTDSFMLVPTKSVTAVIGLTTEKTPCYGSGCDQCGDRECQFRKEQ